MTSPLPNEPAAPRTPESEPEELAQFIRKNLLRAVMGLAAIGAVLAVVGKLYETELLTLGQQVYEALGVPGLLGVVLVTDALISPMPPDVVLVVMANSLLHEHWPVLLPAIGLTSAAAGCLGWYLGGRAASIPRLSGLVVRLRKQHEPLLRRYDGWAVILGALTPLPFSVICITAGALGMPLARLAPLTLFRIPKFVLFYWVIYFSTRLGG